MSHPATARRKRRLAALGVLVSSTLLVGCDGARPAAPPAVKQPRETTEQAARRKFKNIVQEVQRRLNAVRSAPAPIAGGPSVEWSSKVADEVIPPIAEGLAWRAKITVETRSTVTVIGVTEDDRDDDPRRRPDEEEAGTTREDDTEADAPADPAAAPQPERGKGAFMREFSDQEREVFELIYEDNRWRLVTLPDPNTQMELVFELALRSQ